MVITKTKISGLYIIEHNILKDTRGEFIKIFNNEIFEQQSILVDFKEIYYSISKKDTIRGMHFQKEPYEIKKLVHVYSGEILDVVVDIRKDSPTYKQYFSIPLSQNKMSLFIGKGLAHGFLALTDDVIMSYNVSGVFNKECDTGIAWNSFGFDWGVSHPIMSDKDKNLKSLEEYENSNR